MSTRSSHPTARRVSYIRKHNIYVHPVGHDEERQLTKDGSETLLNGEVDWVYEEELYSRSNYFWSPDGKQIVFLQMNEAEVPTYPITDWIPTHATVDQEKYPQPGDPNPGVRLAVVGTDGGKTKWITVKLENGSLPLGNDPNVLIPRFGWVRNGLLWAMVLNRVQDRMDLYFIDADNGKSQLMMTETTDAWIDMHPEVDFTLLESGDGYLWTSWRDGHNHIYLYRFDKQKPLSGPAQNGGAAHPRRLGGREHRRSRRQAGHGLLLGERRRLAPAERVRGRTEWAKLPSHLEAGRHSLRSTSIPRTPRTTWTITRH